ncbi:MAG: hypothetical protein ACI8UO_000506 [Verrucomicrobiales bacterium]|jgi:hypothetical protein
MSALINSLTKALQADPTDWETRSALVGVLIDENQPDEARKLLADAGEIPDEGPDLELAKKSYHMAGLEFPEPDVAIAVIAEDDDDEEAVVAAVIVDDEDSLPEPYSKSEPEIVPLAYSKSEPETVPVAYSKSEPAPEPEPETKAAPESEPEAQADSVSESDAERRAFYVIETTPEELEELHRVEHIAEIKCERTAKRNRINALAVTILLHVGIFILLGFIVISMPSENPPNVVAMAGPAVEDDSVLDPTELNRPTPQQTTAAAASIPDIISVEAFSSVALSSNDLQVTTAPPSFGVSYTPSMSFGMPSGGSSMMLFGEKLIEKGETLGVILDVSGSMAEYLPRVIREIDRNFDNTPIVYVNNTLIRPTSVEVEIRRIVEEEVMPYYPDRTHTPYWFLWHDLPRKAPQPAVDRLMEYFKKRPNAFIAVGGYNRVTAAAKFLAEQKVDALYVFSDFEDYVDEDLALELGQLMGRSSIKTFIQPARENPTDYIKIMAQKVANRSKGKQLQPLVAIAEEEDTSIMARLEDNTIKPEDMEDQLGVNYANARPEAVGTEFYEFRPQKDWYEIARLQEPEYEVVFYGPEARGEIFMKTDDGFIQHPITFGYHSWKDVQAVDAQVRYRRRKFLRNEEEPTFDGQEIVWKMILEDELPFEVHLYLDRKGMNATYVADPPKDGTNDAAYIYFRVPPLVREREDKYYGYDIPPTGLTLAQVREYAQFNTATFNLPNAEADRFGSHWNQIGFEPGYNPRKFHDLVRQMPSGIRDVVVEGPSFGPRKFHARTTSSRILLTGGAGRADIELWESFHCRLVRPADRRTRFTKTEAIAIQIE